MDPFVNFTSNQFITSGSQYRQRPVSGERPSRRRRTVAREENTVTEPSNVIVEPSNVVIEISDSSDSESVIVDLPVEQNEQTTQDLLEVPVTEVEPVVMETAHESGSNDQTNDSDVETSNDAVPEEENEEETEEDNDDGSEEENDDELEEEHSFWSTIIVRKPITYREFVSTIGSPDNIMQ